MPSATEQVPDSKRNGYFELSLPAGNVVLRVSMIGYQDEDIRLTNVNGGTGILGCAQNDNKTVDLRTLTPDYSE
jgi:hypothetical protein